MHCKMKTYVNGPFDNSQLTIFLQNKHVICHTMACQNGELQIVSAITSRNSNTSIWIILQVTKVIAMFLVCHSIFLVEKVLLQDYLVKVAIRKSNVNFGDVIQRPSVLLNLDQGEDGGWFLALHWRSLRNGEGAKHDKTQ